MSDRSIDGGSRFPLRQAVARSVVLLGVTAGAWLAGSLANSAFADTPSTGATSTAPGIAVQHLVPAGPRSERQAGATDTGPAVVIRAVAPAARRAVEVPLTVTAKVVEPIVIRRSAAVPPTGVVRSPRTTPVSQAQHQLVVPVAPHIARPITTAAAPVVHRLTPSISPAIAPTVAAAHAVVGESRPVTAQVLEAARPVVEPLVRAVQTLPKMVAPVLVSVHPVTAPLLKPAVAVVRSATTGVSAALSDLRSLTEPKVHAVTSTLTPVANALAPLLDVLVRALPAVGKLPVVAHGTVTVPVTASVAPAALAGGWALPAALRTSRQLPLGATTSPAQQVLSSKSADADGATVPSAWTGRLVALKAPRSAGTVLVGAVTLPARASVGAGHALVAVQQEPSTQLVAAPAVGPASVDLPIAPAPGFPPAPATPGVALTSSTAIVGSHNEASLLADVPSSAQVQSALFLMALFAAAAPGRGRLADRPSFCPD